MNDVVRQPVLRNRIGLRDGDGYHGASVVQRTRPTPGSPIGVLGGATLLREVRPLRRGTWQGASHQQGGEQRQCDLSEFHREADERSSAALRSSGGTAAGGSPESWGTQPVERADSSTVRVGRMRQRSNQATLIETPAAADTGASTSGAATRARCPRAVRQGCSRRVARGLFIADPRRALLAAATITCSVRPSSKSHPSARGWRGYTEQDDLLAALIWCHAVTGKGFGDNTRCGVGAPRQGAPAVVVDNRIQIDRIFNLKPCGDQRRGGRRYRQQLSAIAPTVAQSGDAFFRAWGRTGRSIEQAVLH